MKIKYHLVNKLMYLISLLVIFFSCGSHSNRSHQKVTEDIAGLSYLGFELKEGDLLFQDSDCGPFCESIEKVTSGINGSNFSHVGLVVVNDDEEYVVLEAITKGVVETPLDTFFSRSFDTKSRSKVVVGRMKKEHQQLIPSAVGYAKTKLGSEYDDVFDIANDKYYCSELIYESFKVANDHQDIFVLQAMTYKDPDTDATFPVWKSYFEDLNQSIPEGELGLNPGGMSKNQHIDIVHFYGTPEGYKP